MNTIKRDWHRYLSGSLEPGTANFGQTDRSHEKVGWRQPVSICGQLCTKLRTGTEKSSPRRAALKLWGSLQVRTDVGVSWRWAWPKAENQIIWISSWAMGRPTDSCGSSQGVNLHVLSWEILGCWTTWGVRLETAPKSSCVSGPRSSQGGMWAGKSDLGACRQLRLTYDTS